MKRTLALNLGSAALLLSAALSGARAATEEINFQGALTTPILGDTSVSGQFGFDFATDKVTNYKFTAPGDSFDSANGNGAAVTPFTSRGTSYFNIEFSNASESQLELVVNSAITEFFTQAISLIDGRIYQSQYACLTGSCFSGGSLPLSFFTSGAVTGSIPEPSTWAMMALGFGLLGCAGYRRAGKDSQSALG
jgi:hypothetical protein